ncbi:hypothetical protein [Dysgonomonas sp. 520]|uniref:hypothetical protein n=1 Tax=Dysgonomonas sp. 520 TaxID=2302931 RepID=UPI0013D0A7D2|nr:hypothetical protein [Dysgonomonas sp. 520]NDW10924.1 hypothetical protein [Dysgonomonas sp. 520]
MDIGKLLKSIERIRVHGDAVRIARKVNEDREKNGEKKITPEYVRMMLTGDRKMTADVAEFSETYFKTIEKLMI